MIIYRKTGGFAAEDEVLTLNEQGELTLSRSFSGRKVVEVEKRIEEKRTKKLFDSLKEINFQSLGEEYKAEKPVYDGYTHTITISNGGLRKTVTIDTEAAIPECLKTLISEIESIIAYV